MLIRVVVNNILSFGNETEFNLFPAGPKFTRLGHHKYSIGSINLLKLSAIYGANGAGKSNLVKALGFLKDLVINERIPPALSRNMFKFSIDGRSQVLAIEFFSANTPFYYGVEIKGKKVLTEELYISGLGEKDDELVFERKTINDKETTLRFFPEFEEDRENQTLKRVLEKNLIKVDKPIIKLLTELDSPALEKVEDAYLWFTECLRIVYPSSKPVALPLLMEKKKEFQEYAVDIMASFDTGVNQIHIETKSLQEFFGENEKDRIPELSEKLEDNPKGFIQLENLNGERVVVAKEEDEIVVKRLVLEHETDSQSNILFHLDEESDGTVRLLDYLPLFFDIVHKPRVYIVDEIERSIHPLLIKELIEKFSKEKETKGQLIFTTHESNLLDQNILRQDEIWFAEKDKQGCTSFFPLSEFKEHHTKDISKGYLNGRYGAIPFLGDLKRLNWNQYALAE